MKMMMKSGSQGAWSKERTVPELKERTVKLFAGIHKSSQFTAASAHKAFAGAKLKK